MLSSEATTCRLFFTRWWTSRTSRRCPSSASAISRSDCSIRSTARAKASRSSWISVAGPSLLGQRRARHRRAGSWPTARCSRRSGRISSRVTSSQVISAAMTHISSGSRSSSRSSVVIARHAAVDARRQLAVAERPAGDRTVARRRQRRVGGDRRSSSRVAVADRTSASNSARSSQRGVADFARREMRVGRHPADHPDAERSAPRRSGATRSWMSPGATSGRSPVSPTSPTAHSGVAVGVWSSKRWATAGRDRQRALRRRAQASPAGRASAPLAAIRSASALRAIRLSMARAAARACSSDCALSAALASRMPLYGDPDQAEADRQQRRGKDQQQLGRGRQAGEALRRAAQSAAAAPAGGSAELAEQIR